MGDLGIRVGGCLGSLGCSIGGDLVVSRFEIQSFE